MYDYSFVKVHFVYSFEFLAPRCLYHITRLPRSQSMYFKKIRLTLSSACDSLYVTDARRSVRAFELSHRYAAKKIIQATRDRKSLMAFLLLWLIGYIPNPLGLFLFSFLFGFFHNR